MKEEKLFCIRYNKENDSFRLYFTDHDGEWAMAYEYKCVHYENENPREDEAMFIYIDILDEMKKYAELGYTFVGW